MKLNEEHSLSKYVRTYSVTLYPNAYRVSLCFFQKLNQTEIEKLDLDIMIYMWFIILKIN